MYNRVMAEETTGITPWDLRLEYTAGYQPVKEKVEGRITDCEQHEWPFSELVYSPMSRLSFG